MAKTEANWQADQQKEANLSGFSTALSLFLNGLIIAAMLWFSSQAEFGKDEYRMGIYCALHFAP